MKPTWACHCSRVERKNLDLLEVQMHSHVQSVNTTSTRGFLWICIVTVTRRVACGSSTFSSLGLFLGRKRGALKIEWGKECRLKQYLLRLWWSYCHHTEKQRFSSAWQPTVAKASRATLVKREIIPQQSLSLKTTTRHPGEPPKQKTIVPSCVCFPATDLWKYTEQYTYSLKKWSLQQQK